MNKKSLRYLLPLTLILSLLLSVTAFADTSSPTAAQDICVDLQPPGARPAGNGEPVAYSLTTGGNTTNHTATTDENGCFEVAAVGVGTYDVVIDGADHLATPTLSMLLNGDDDDYRTGNSQSNPIVTLREGDVDGNGIVAGPDASLLVGALGGADAVIDLDENGIVAGPDASLLVGNLNQTDGRSAASSSVHSGSRAGATVTLNPATVTATAGDRFYVEVVVGNVAPDMIDTVQLDVEFDTTRLTMVPQFGALPGSENFAFATSANCAALGGRTCLPANAAVISTIIDNTAGTASALAAGDATSEAQFIAGVMYFEAKVDISRDTLATIVEVKENPDPTVPANQAQGAGAYYVVAGQSFPFVIIGDTTAVAVSSVDANVTQGIAQVVIPLMVLSGLAVVALKRRSSEI